MRALLLTLFVMPLFCLGQFTDDFSDGNHSANPAWIDNNGVFEVNSLHQLWLNAPPVSATASIVTRSRAIKNASWMGKVAFDFNPSASNLAYIYLCSNSSALQDSLDGYYLKIGGTNDDISLWRQSGNTHVQLIDGADDLIDQNTVLLRFHVTRNNWGFWSLIADTGNTTPTTLQGTATDNIVTESRFFGIRCQYTSTRSDGFYFDDFLVNGTPYQDTLEPKIQSLIVHDSAHLTLKFTEPIFAPPLSNLTFAFFPDESIIITPHFTAAYQDEVSLSVSQPLQAGSSNWLVINNLEDSAGNIGIDSVRVEYFNPKTPGFKGLQFNELFVDPSPQIGLADAEYIEIQNQTNHYIDLNGLTITDLISSSIYNQSIMLAPGALAVLCDEDDVHLFSDTAVLVAFKAMPSLNNTNERLWLTIDSSLIDFISYTDAWYQIPEKTDGGYSLERINPNRPCHDPSNWKASNDPSGGSPGKPNSNLDTNPDNLPPTILSATWLNSYQLQIKTNESLDTGVISTNSFIRNDSVAASSIQFEADQLTVTLTWETPIYSGVGYDVGITHLTDCVGNQKDTVIRTALGAKPTPFDLIINEIFTKPVNSTLPLFEYVEIYNRSQRVLSTTGISLNDRVATGTLPTALIWPGEHVILCDEDAVSDFQGFGRVISIANMPSLNDADDELFLLLNDTISIDQMAYNQDYFHPDRTYDEGWSLERISYDRLCYGRTNWSSSVDRIGGTPGNTNSIWEAIPSDLPLLKDVFFANKTSVFLMFNQRLKANSAYEVSFNGHIQAVIASGKEEDEIILKDSLEMGVEHTIEVIGLLGCDQQLSGRNSIKRYLWKTGDVVVNEILFNPRGSGSDHVELFNRSTHPINLLGWSLPSMNEDSTWEHNIISDTSFYLLSNDYVAITSDIKSTLQNYPFAPEYKLRKGDLPTYANTEGIVWLLDAWNQITDRVEYHEDMHFPLINDPDGVALERVTQSESMDHQSVLWQSASSEDNYGTPGYLNSQDINRSSSEEQVWLSNKTISPNNDGYQDNVLIHYNLHKPGQTLSVEVYNDDGFFISQPTSNELVGASGARLWNGLSQEGLPLNTGIYIILVRVFDINQGEKRFKLPIVMNAGR
jgi:hypothetical protein